MGVTLTCISLLHTYQNEHFSYSIPINLGFVLMVKKNSSSCKLKSCEKTVFNTQFTCLYNTYSFIQNNIEHLPHSKHGTTYSSM